MRSIQSSVSSFIIKSLKKTLFIQRTEVITQRIGFERIANFTKFPRAVVEEKANLNGINVTWFLPKKRDSQNKVILYLHGGGYCVGSVSTHRGLIARIARSSKCKAIGIDYRLAPENPYPSGLEDALTVYEKLLEQGYNNIVLAGDSAGGGLCMALMLRLKALKTTLPTAAVLLSPWVDLTMSGDSIRTKANRDPLISPEILSHFASKYTTSENYKHPEVSPLFGQLKDLPPIFIQVGGNEILLDDSTRLAKQLSKANVSVEIKIWKNQMHVWQWLAGIVPEANHAIKDIGKFIIEQLKFEADIKKAVA